MYMQLAECKSHGHHVPSLSVTIRTRATEKSPRDGQDNFIREVDQLLILAQTHSLNETDRTAAAQPSMSSSVFSSRTMSSIRSTVMAASVANYSLVAAQSCHSLRATCHMQALHMDKVRTCAHKMWALLPGLPINGQDAVAMEIRNGRAAPAQS
jgi:hypothetical protein